MKKYYAVYLAYSKYEVLPDEIASDPEISQYPRNLAIIVKCASRQEQLDCYANTKCPASQMLEANSSKELQHKVEELKRNFEDEAWLEKHIYPYI